MDPEIALRTMLDEQADPADRYHAAIDLLTWLYADGFCPTEWNPVQPEHRRIETLREKCQQVKAATRPAPPTPSH